MAELVPVERIFGKIFFIRNTKVMLDRDLADLYRVETKVLKQAVRRNIKRFPDDFMFDLTYQEFRDLRSQFVTSSWGGVRYPVYAFVEWVDLKETKIADWRSEPHGGGYGHGDIEKAIQIELGSE